MGSGGRSGSPSTEMRLHPAVSYPLAGGRAALLSVWVQNDNVWMDAVSWKHASLGCFMSLQAGCVLFPGVPKSL